MDFNLDHQRSEGVKDDHGDCYFFAQQETFSALIGKLLCPICCQPGVKFKIVPTSKSGFSVKGQLECGTWQQSLAKSYMCNRVSDSSSGSVAFGINIRTVLAFRGVGCGHSAIRKWCGIMNMPYSLSKNGYSKNQKKIEEAALKTFESISDSSRSGIVAAYEDIGVEPDEQGVLDIGVTFDGSN